MGIGERLAGFYAGIEDKWFALLDWFDAKGIPVYAYSDFFETKGIPSLPVTIAIVFIMAFLLFGFFFIGNTISPTITIGIANQFDEEISGVRITATNTQGQQLKVATISNGGSLQLEGIPIGTTITLAAEKDGYKKAIEEIDITKEKLNIFFVLQEESNFIDAKVLLQDAISSDPVKGARIVATYRNISREATTDSAGIAAIPQIPAGTDISLEIISDAYETISDNFAFAKGETKTIALQPKSVSLQGKTRLMITIKDAQGNNAKDTEITIRDKTSDSILYQATATNGEYSADISKGTSVRIIAEKNGFLRYDSQLSGETRTVRLEEETWNIVLQPGGTKLKINVLTEAGTAIENATVQLFYETELLDSKQTDFLGTTEFSDLNAEKFFATAYYEGYLPQRQEIDLGLVNETTIKLKAADATNSSYFAVYVTDVFGAMANNTSLSFFEKIQGTELPLGIPSTATDLSGYASARAQIGTEVVVHAVRNLETGTGEKTIQANVLNEIPIILFQASSIIELGIFDEFGNPAQGSIIITSPEGELLFDGNFSEGKVFFDGQGKERANVAITTLDGKTFSEQIDISGKDKVEIKLGEAPSGLYPEIIFAGIFDASGKQVDAIVPGKFFWLKFETSWPSGNYSGGAHVRIGSDDTKFVDSEEAGIMGFDAVGTTFRASKSYQPFPEPGNETADRLNKGQLGEYNKWIELQFEKPKNNSNIRIKIQARESIQAESIEVQYRAWANIGSEVYRNPEDSALGKEKFVNSKTGLYAETKTETINVAASLPECKKELCASYYFLQKNGLIIQATDFKPLLNETYALEIDLLAARAMATGISLETGTPALLYFTGYEMDSFDNTPSGIQEPLPATTSLEDLNAGLTTGYLANPGSFIINKTNNNSGSTLLFADAGAEETTGTALTSGYLGETENPTALEQNPFGFQEQGTQTKIAIPGINLAPNMAKKIRVYFKTVDSGEAFIKTDITASGIAISKTFNFTVPKEKQLAITVSPEEVLVGKDFTINVMDKETNSPVTNATIHLISTGGETVFSLVGDASKGKGLNGNYEFKNNFDPGTYLAEVTAPDYVPAEKEISIAIDGLMQISKEIKISIPAGQIEGVKTENITNKSEQDIAGLSYEIKTGSNFPDEFSVRMELPAIISAKQSAPATVIASVNLTEESKESLHGEAEITLIGTVAGQFPTKTKTKLIIDYNKKFSSDCLKFDTQELRVKLIGRAGSSAQTQLEIENNCEADLVLTPQIEAKEQDPNLMVNMPQVTIEKGAKQAVPVSVSNSIDRIYSMQKTFSYEITFDSAQVSKTASLKVELWNPVSNVAFPPQVSLFLSRTQGYGYATDSKPLYLRNTGQEPISGFRIAVDDAGYKQYGIVAYLAPMTADYGFLPAGGVLSPTRYVVAQTSNTVPLPFPAMGQIHYTGIAMGQQMDFGTTTVSVNYSGNQCLKLSAKGSLVFESKESYGIQKKQVTIRNDCGEEVRISEILPKAIGNNSLYLLPSQATIMPNSETQVELQLNITQKMNKTEQIRFKGWLVRSQKWIESNQLQARIDIGEKARITESEPQGSKVKMKVCGTEEEIEVTFPKTGDCSAGYCDAKTFAEKLVEKINAMIKEAREKAARAQNRAEQFSCSNQNYCTFSDLGVKTQGFEAYSQLDNMTPELIRDVVEEKDILELKGQLSVEKRTDIVDEDGLGNVAATGFTRSIFLGTEFAGCGKYFINIYGAVQVSNNEIQEDKFMILVKPELYEEGKAKKDTASCQAEIQNIANFLPVDEGLNSNDNKAWPGLVSFEEEKAKTIAEETAKQLFKAEQGRTISATQMANNLKIIIGGNEEGLVKLSLEQIDNPNTQKTITANVISSAASNAKTASEIASAINSIVKGAPGKDACISKDKSYMIVKSYSKPGEGLQISGDKEIPVSGGETSAELTITGVPGDKVKITTDFENKNLPGIEYIKIVDEKGKELLKISGNGQNLVPETQNELELKATSGTANPGSSTARTMEETKQETALLADADSPNATIQAANAALDNAIKALEELKGKISTEQQSSISGKAAELQALLNATPPDAAKITAKIQELNSTIQTIRNQVSPATQPQNPAPEPAGQKASAKIKVIIKGAMDAEHGALYVTAPEAIKSITINAEPIEGPASRATQKGQEITLKVCGMFVSDFINKMNSISPDTIKGKPDKKLVAYATIGWKGSPEALDFAYLQNKFAAGIEEKNAGQRYGITGDVANNQTYKTAMANKKMIALGGYLAACIPVSVVAGIKFGLGGPIINPLLDCGLPALWAAKQIAPEYGPNAKSVAEGIDSIVKKIPLIGNWLVGENGTQIENPQSFSETLLGPAIFGTTLDASIFAVSNAGAVVSDRTATDAANEISAKIVDYIRKTKFPKATAGSEIDTLLNNMRTKLSTQIKSNIMLKYNTNPLANKLISSSLEASTTEALGTVGKDLGVDVIKAGSASTPAKQLESLQDSYKTAKKEVIQTIFSDDELAQRVRSAVVTELPGESAMVQPDGTWIVPEDWTNFKDTTWNSFKNNVEKSLREQIGPQKYDDLIASSPEFVAAKNKVLNSFKNEIKGKARTTQAGGIYSARYAGSIDDDARKVAATLKTEFSKNADAIIEKIGYEKIGDSIVKQASEGAWEGANNLKKGLTPASKEWWSNLYTRIKGSIRSVWSAGAAWELGKNFFKGALGGVLSNLAGMAGWKAAWYALGPGTGVAADSTTSTPQTGTPDAYIPGKGIIGGIKEITKNNTYKVEITLKSDGGRNFNVLQVGTDDKFAEMLTEIKSKKAELWEPEPAKCSDFLTKELSETSIGELRPEWSTSADSKYVISYYGNDSAFANARIGNPSDLADDVLEENIIALMIVQPEKTGCEIPADWTAKSREEIKGYAECVAGKIRGKTFTEEVRNFAKGDNAYYANVLNTSKKWAKPNFP